MTLDLIHRLGTPDPQIRERAADEVTDVLGGLPPDAVAALTLVLAMAAAVESSPQAQEAQLHALIELDTRHGPLNSLAVARLGDLDRDALGAHPDYLDDLRRN